MGTLIADIATFITPVVVTVYSLYNFELAWGFPWRPRRFGLPESPRQRRQRWMALTVAILTSVLAFLLVITVKLAADRFP